MPAPESLGMWGALAALAGGAIRGSIPYMYVSLGECLTEKSGRINLGMEGILLMGAMTAFAVSDRSGSAWMGAIAAAIVAAALGLLHGALTELPGVNDIAAGIAMIIFGSGLAFFFGKQFVAPMAPQLPVLDLGSGIANTAVHAALRVSPLFFLGIGAALLLHYLFERTRWGLISVRRNRIVATSIGAALAGIGGSHLTLYFPGIWSEGISGGQGLMAVALVIFARWSPLRCLAASLLFGGAQALGPSLQSAGITGFYHIFNASPYLLTLAVMVISCSRSRTLAGIPGALARRG
jgi:ABC-type uncharacterized transport system permease subunit